MPLSRFLSLTAEGSLQNRMAVGQLVRSKGSIRGMYIGSRGSHRTTVPGRGRSHQHTFILSLLWQSYTYNSSRLKLQRKYSVNCKLEEFSAPMNFLALSFQNNQKQFVLPRELNEKKKVLLHQFRTQIQAVAPLEQYESQK